MRKIPSLAFGLWLASSAGAVLGQDVPEAPIAPPTPGPIGPQPFIAPQQQPQPTFNGIPPGAIGAPGAPVFGSGGAMPPEPMPIFHAHPGYPNPALQPPPLPPYAWPTYAPYNNYSRVAYPEQYNYEQWPFIGPMYPFPKVPLGWRAVTLRWQDGYWWYARTPTGHDWWRIRYW